MEHEARRVLKEVFGYEGFRPRQESIIASVASGRDVIAVMPTGGGKSLCYQIPALLLQGTALVVSPLISLMRDQVGFLRGLGVDARFLNSSLEREEYAAASAEARSGALKLLYAAPETVLRPGFLELFGPRGPSFITVDEAHCVSEWGHDFRPEYRRLSEIRGIFPSAGFLALTATATERVRADIERNLALRDPERVVAGFDRPNIRLEVAPKADALSQAEDFIKSMGDVSGIVYCLSRKRVDEVAAALCARGIPAAPYHAGMDDAARSANQDRFIRDEIGIIVATVAFGMGIDKPDVRFVLHMDLPKSVEGYYQEIGRAGRDGLPARALLLYSYGDARKLEFTLEGKEGAELEAARAMIRSIVRYAEASSCRRKALLSYFGQDYGKDSCASCDVCADPASRAEITEDAWKLLSAILRTGERYGPSYVVDVLRGEATDRVAERGHGSLPLFGIGKGSTRSEWMSFIRGMASSGYLDVEAEYGILSLTEKARGSLASREPVLGRPLAAVGGKSRKKRSAPPAREGGRTFSALEGVEGLNAGLVAELRALRTRLARESSVPPYVIYSDRTLADIALKRPRNEAELLEVFGMGKKKAAKLGPGILEAVKRSREA
jgi:ATP-dependent DNA helicase RecQ